MQKNSVNIILLFEHNNATYNYWPVVCSTRLSNSRVFIGLLEQAIAIFLQILYSSVNLIWLNVLIVRIYGIISKSCQNHKFDATSVRKTWPCLVLPIHTTIFSQSRGLIFHCKTHYSAPCPDSKQEKITTVLARFITENLLSFVGTK